MRIIKPAKLAEFVAGYPDAREPLDRWLSMAKRAHWRNLHEMRATFPGADEVMVASRKKVVVFNIKGNHYRLITAVHFEMTVHDQEGKPKLIEGRVYLFFLLTHAKYDKDLWKARL